MLLAGSAITISSVNVKITKELAKIISVTVTSQSLSNSERVSLTTAFTLNSSECQSMARARRFSSPKSENIRVLEVRWKYLHKLLLCVHLPKFKSRICAVLTLRVGVVMLQCTLLTNILTISNFDSAYSSNARKGGTVNISVVS